MNYLLSDKNKFTLEIEAYKQKYQHYVIVKKRQTINELIHEDNFCLYELENSEQNLPFEGETLVTFREKYLTQALKENEEIIMISIYKDRNTIHEIGKKIQVLLFEPNQKGYVKEIEHTRMELSKIVEGDIEYVHLGRKDMALICNETGMLQQLPQHRGFHGTFLVVGLESGETASLTQEQIQEVLQEFDKRENYISKSKYLKAYFEEHNLPRKVFSYSFDDTTYYIGTEKIIEFILSQEEKEVLQMIELEFRDIERNKGDIYPYLKKIGYQMVKK